ncbi:MAG: hypothetical protein WCW27_00865 [Patescibacteria group bacterium]|jgi:hypothetical protein
MAQEPRGSHLETNLRGGGSEGGLGQEHQQEQDGLAGETEVETDPREHELSAIVQAVNGHYERWTTQNLVQVESGETRQKYIDEVQSNSYRSGENKKEVEKLTKNVRVGRVTAGLHERIIRDTLQDATLEQLQSVLQEIYTCLNELASVRAEGNIIGQKTVKDLLTNEHADSLAMRVIKNLAVFGDTLVSQVQNDSFEPLAVVYEGVKENGRPSLNEHFSMNNVNRDIVWYVREGSVLVDPAMIKDALAARAVKNAIDPNVHDRIDNYGLHQKGVLSKSYFPAFEKLSWKFETARDGNVFAVAPGGETSAVAQADFNKRVKEFRKYAERPVAGITELPPNLMTRENLVEALEQAKRDKIDLKTGLEARLQDAVEQLGILRTDRTRISNDLRAANTDNDTLKVDNNTLTTELNSAQRQLAEEKTARQGDKKAIAASLEGIVKESGFLAAGVIAKLRRVLEEFKK